MTVTVAHLFDETALTDDPVFVAYLDERDPLVVADNGVTITQSNIQFAFFEPGEVGILTAESAREGDMSTLVDHVCRHFGVRDIAFINALNRDLDDKLHGFEATRRDVGGEVMRCLVGEWRPDEEVMA